MTISLYIYIVASKCAQNHVISEKYTTFNYISVKSVPLCNYTLLSVTVKLFETLLEANL